MTPLENAKRAAAQLSLDEVAALRRWLAELEAAMWDRELLDELLAIGPATPTAGAMDFR